MVVTKIDRSVSEFGEVLTCLGTLRPGENVAFKFDGGGQNLIQAARIGCTLLWYEEAIA